MLLRIAENRAYILRKSFYVRKMMIHKFRKGEFTEKLNELLAEYRMIEQHLEEALLDKGKEKEYRDLIELITRIADYIFADTGKARKGVGDVMGGNVLELESLEEISRFSGLEPERIEQLKQEENL